MPLGLSPIFVIFLILSIGLSMATNNWMNGVVLMGMFAAVTLFWRFLTR